MFGMSLVIKVLINLITDIYVHGSRCFLRFKSTINTYVSLITALGAGQNFILMRSMLRNLAMVGIFLCGEALDDEFADFFFYEFLWYS
jgi:hypothetical protein